MIAAIVLAAGASRRFGRPKQLLAWRGVTLVRHAAGCAAVAGCDPVIVVVGHAAAEVARAVEGSGAEIVANPGWAGGMATSIRTGIAAVRRRAAVEAALLLTCDQPLLTAALIRRQLAAFGDAPADAVACEYAGRLGVPALFAAKLFDELEHLEGDRGARAVLERRADRVVRLAWPDGAVDVDRREDYEGLGSFQ